MVVRHDGPYATLAQPMRQAVWDFDPNLPVSGLAPMNARISNSITQPRFYTILLSTFAVVALLLAAAGIYGTMAYAVGQRKRVMSIRVALGAESHRVRRLVIGQGMSLVLLGIGGGLAGALGLSRVLTSFVFGITTTDVPTFSAVALVLALVAWLACYLPARRATQVDPIVALRAE